MFRVFDLARRASDTISGNVIHAYQVVRQYQKTHRRDHRHLHPSARYPRRVTFPVARAISNDPIPIAPPLPPQAVTGLLVDRKRKVSGSPLPMSRAKRHDNGSQKSSPWGKEDWLQQHPEEGQVTSYGIGVRRLHSNWKQRRPTRRPPRWDPYRFRRPTSPKRTLPERVNFVRPGLGPWDRMSEASEESNRSSPISPQEIMPAHEESIHMDIDEKALQAADFTPVKPPDPEPELKTARKDFREEPDESSNTEDKVTKEEEDDDWAWDQEGQAETRKLLRSLPESHDEEGYKVPIDGFISPVTQAWNEEHRRKLLREAAHAQQTPSRMPKYRSPSVEDYDSDESENEKISGDRPHTKVQSTLMEGQGTKSQAQGSGEQNTADVLPSTLNIDGTDGVLSNGLKKESASPAPTQVKLESTPVQNVKEEDKTPQTLLPLAEIKNLSLGSKEIRTPKSKIYEAFKSERLTRTQKIKAELQAKKNAYPMVPLSKNWDTKVRQAVNNGHGRFEAKMFNKCVPEYSNDPTAGSLWLDDAVINDYIAMVAKHGSKDDRKTQVRSVSALSSFFYTKISASSPNYSSCAGMVKRAGIQGKNLLECEKIFIPINRSYHWTLAVIQPKVPEGEGPLHHKRKITIYNSMGSSGGQQVASHIYKWLQHELGASFKPEEWEIHPAGTSPQQRNSDDCGVFTVTTARQIMLDRYVPDMYESDIIRIQRKRIVAELVNGGLLNKEESES